MESAASGLIAGLSLARALRGKPEAVLGGCTVMGALERYVRTPSADYQPMNANFGILDPMKMRIRGKRQRYEALAQRALERMDELIVRHNLEE